MSSIENNRFLHGKELYDSIVGSDICDVNVLVGQLLMGLGFKNKLIGTRFLHDAILYRYERADEAHVSYSNEVYSAVAEKQNSTASCVERAIRNAIVDCKNFGNLDALDELLHGRVSVFGYTPSNSELISSIVGWLQIEKEKGHIK